MLAEAARLTPDQAMRLRRRIIAQRAARTFTLERGDFIVDDSITLPVVPGSELDIRTITYLGAKQFVSEARLNFDLVPENYDRVTAEMVTKLGMVPQQMNNPDIVPALASGRLDAVMTSGTTAVAQKYWEFLKHTYNTNHLWASNLMVVGNSAWTKLSTEHRAAIAKLATEMEPGFWDVSKAEHAQRMDQLKTNGMTVEAAPRELLDRMRTITRPMWDEFAKNTGAEGAKLLADYRAKTGK